MKNLVQRSGTRLQADSVARNESVNQQTSADDPSEEDEWENEGRFMELERRLWEGTERSARKKPNPPPRPFHRLRKSEPGNHDDNTERGTDYENDQGTGFQKQGPTFGISTAIGKTEKQSGDQIQNGEDEAASRQEFENDPSGHSSHPARRRPGTGVLPGKNLQGTRAGYSLISHTNTKLLTTRNCFMPRRKATGKPVNKPAGRKARHLREPGIASIRRITSRKGTM